MIARERGSRGLGKVGIIGTLFDGIRIDGLIEIELNSDLSDN